MITELATTEPQDIDKTYELRVTSEQLADIQRSEAVAVRNYSNDSGDLWARVIRIGTAEEMQIVADTNCLLIVPDGLHIDGQQMVLVKDLL